MLHKETVSTVTWDLLIRMMQDDILSQFILVGGTSLALQLGHRLSVDIDLFSAEPFDEGQLSEYLQKNYGLELDFMDRHTVKGEIQGIQIDCIAHQYPWVADPTTEESVRLASIPDIAAMKLNAVSGNGTRIKDFIDIAYMSSLMSFQEMLDAYMQKYHANPVIPIKALTFWEDIRFDEPVKMMDTSTFQWKMIASRLTQMQANPKKKFGRIL